MMATTEAPWWADKKYLTRDDVARIFTEERQQIENEKAAAKNRPPRDMPPFRPSSVSSLLGFSKPIRNPKTPLPPGFRNRYETNPIPAPEYLDPQRSYWPPPADGTIDDVVAELRAWWRSRPGPGGDHRSAGYVPNPLRRVRPEPAAPADAMSSRTDPDRFTPLGVRLALDCLTEETTSLPIERLPLTPRAYNALMRGKVGTIGELLGHSEAELRDIRAFGRGSTSQVQTHLVQLHDQVCLCDRGGGR